MVVRRWLALLAVAATLAAALLALSSQTPGRAGTACTPSWRVVAHAGVPPLWEVAALSSSDVWAVGGAYPGRPVIAHWDGSKLQTQSFPWKNGYLAALAAVSSRDVWAVGATDTGSPLIVHWDGRAWQPAHLPVIKDGWLNDVVALSASDVWAVGGGLASNRPLVLHWNGTRWGVLDLRWKVAPHGSDLRAIAATSTHDVWAAGAKGLDAISSYGYRDLVLRWDGRRWAQVPSPLFDQATSGPFAHTIDIAQSGDVWTMNSDLSGNGPWFVRWSGNDRRVAKVYHPDLDWHYSMFGIAPLSANNAWVVGNRGTDPSRPLLVHWNGSSWQVQHTGLDNLKNTDLSGLSILSATDIWAVGKHLIARYSC